MNTCGGKGAGNSNLSTRKGVIPTAAARSGAVQLLESSELGGSFPQVPAGGDVGDAGEAMVGDYLIHYVIYSWDFSSHKLCPPDSPPHSKRFPASYHFCVAAGIPHSPSGTAGIQKSRGRKKKTTKTKTLGGRISRQGGAPAPCRHRTHLLRVRTRCTECSSTKTLSDIPGGTIWSRKLRSGHGREEGTPNPQIFHGCGGL